jgi:DNA-binding NtrC family response regulator/tetratricopeptide (TPR) repeat protein
MPHDESSRTQRPVDRLTGDAPAIRAVREQVVHLVRFDAVGAPQVAPVLIHGETGTGKGLLARIIHDSGPRAGGPFVDVNCAAIPESLLEAELFGFEAGAFTDARRPKPGLIETASGGTLFLDEIDSLGLALQGKLLGILEDRRVRRLGSVQGKRVDVKLVAATKADLSAWVAEQRFRADLYHRLAVVVLALPPLRERGEDPVDLARRFLAAAAVAREIAPRVLAPSAEAWIRRYLWPGNVRELAHLMERATLLSPSEELDAAVLEALARPTPPAPPPEAAEDPAAAERASIRQALTETGGNVVAAARRLGLSRNALRYRLRRYGLDDPGRSTGVRTAERSRTAREAPSSPPPERAAPLPAATHLVVGRGKALTQLAAWLEEALGGARRVVLVTGEPGIGKTTLGDVFLASIAGRPDVWGVRGQCVDHYGAGEPYLPVLEACERLAGSSDGPRFVELLRRYAPTWAAHVLTLSGPAAAGARPTAARGITQERMLREMTTALEKLTADRGLVLWLDDLQWSDLSTLALLAFLARRREPARLLVACAYRPLDVLERDHPLRGVAQELLLHGACRELPLTLLEADDVAGYLEARFGVAPALPELARVLHRRTEGNPLFLVEVVESLVAQDAIRPPVSDPRLDRALDAVSRTVPRSLHQLIEHQVDRLASEDQGLLEAASVAGSVFAAATVTAALGAELTGTEARLAELARRGAFLQASGTAEWPDGTTSGIYAFRHALYEEVIYGRVSPARRAALHQRIGQRLERGHMAAATQIASEPALHFERARDPGRAVLHLERAGRNALRRGAHREAIQHLTHALVLVTSLDDTPERARRELALHLALGPAWMAAAGYAAGEVGATYQRALDLAERLAAGAEQARAMKGLWNFHLVRSELDTARQIGEALLARATRAGDGALARLAHAELGQTCFHRGELTRASAHLEQALAGPEPDPRVLAYRSWTLWFEGGPDQAVRVSAASLDAARQRDDLHDLAFVLGFAMFLRLLLGEHAAVLRLAEESMSLCREQGYPYWRAWGLVASNAATVSPGNCDIPLARLADGVKEYRATGAEVGLGHFLGIQAEALGRAGRAGAGLAVLDEADALVARNGNHYFTAELRRLRGTLLALGGAADAPAAERAFREAIGLARHQGAKAIELRALTGLVRLLGAGTRADAARASLRDLSASFVEGAGTLDLETARASLGRGASGTPGEG